MYVCHVHVQRVCRALSHSPIKFRYNTITVLVVCISISIILLRPDSVVVIVVVGIVGAIRQNTMLYYNGTV